MLIYKILLYTLHYIFVEKKTIICIFIRQEALEAAISEKDAHLALLEVSGLRTARHADEAESLRADRKRLMERLKQEVSYCQIEYKLTFIIQ